MFAGKGALTHYKEKSILCKKSQFSIWRDTETEFVRRSGGLVSHLSAGSDCVF